MVQSSFVLNAYHGSQLLVSVSSSPLRSIDRFSEPAASLHRNVAA